MNRFVQATEATDSRGGGSHLHPSQDEAAIATGALTSTSLEESWVAQGRGKGFRGVPPGQKRVWCLWLHRQGIKDKGMVGSRVKMPTKLLGALPGAETRGTYSQCAVSANQPADSE